MVVELLADAPEIAGGRGNAVEVVRATRLIGAKRGC